MELRCPDCASPEVVPDTEGSADRRGCANCGARFVRDTCLVTIAEAESEAAIQLCAPADPEACGFRFDAERGRRELLDPNGSIWPVNAYSDADEIHALVSTALDVGLIAHADSRATLYIYPLGLSEPDPLVAVDSGRHPTVLGHSLRLRERDGEDPVTFTLRLLEEIVVEANCLIGLDAHRHDRPR